MILVGLCIGEADRLGRPAVEFLDRNGKDVFAVAEAYEEYESLIDGYDDRGVGLLERFILDLMAVSEFFAENDGANIDGALDYAEIYGNDRQMIARWLRCVLEGRHGSGRGDVVRQRLRELEPVILRRRRDIRRDVPRWDPVDVVEVERVRGAISARWPPRGRAWERDIKIFAQTHGRACIEPVVFVTEDHNHFDKRRKRLLELTKVREIEDLSGRPL